MAAYSLQNAGVSTIIIDKAQFPRYKVCGAGLTHKILGIMPYDLSHLFHTTVHSFRFSSGLSDVFIRSSEKPLMYCTMRDELDSYLLEQAIGAGARVVTGVRVSDAATSSDGVYVKTSSGEFKARYLIGADGASSKVARLFSLNRGIEWGMAWEAELEVGREVLEKYRSTVFLDWGTFPGGYAWIFPKKDHMSVGIGGPARLSGLMPQYYRDFTASTGIDFLRTISNKSFPLPVRTRKSQFHRDRVLVAGDAAGLTDELTGEGIYWAVKSGILAADSIKHALRSGSGLESYSRSINEQVMPELMEAGNICSLFNAMPLRVHHWVRDHDRVWNAFGKVLRGERCFLDVPGAFGRWKPLWRPVCSLGALIQKGKEFQYKRRHGK
jgi:geranylgeranyl reductase family protein